MTIAKLVVVVVCTCLCCSVVKAQQPGDLDLSFGVDGLAVTAFPNDNNFSEGYGIVVQPDGRIVVGGHSTYSDHWDFSLVRHLPDGSRDSNFGTDGRVHHGVAGFSDTQKSIQGIALQDDDRIVAVGYSLSLVPETLEHAVVIRYDTDGSLDDSFATNGIRRESSPGQYDRYNAVAIQPDGRILTAGRIFNGFNNHGILARYLADGSPDLSFGTNGRISIDAQPAGAGFNAIVLQPDGSIVCVGNTTGPSGSSAYLLARYTVDGVLDPSFGNGGIVAYDFVLGFGDEFATSVALQQDGSIVVAGFVRGVDPFLPVRDMLVARFGSNGSIDGSFGTAGSIAVATVINGFGLSLILRSDDRILLGSALDGVFMVAMLTSNGTLDTGFSDDGLAIIPVVGSYCIGRSIALQPDGKVLLAGNATADTTGMAVIRLHTGQTKVGVEETHSAVGGLLISPNPIRDHVTITCTLSYLQRVDIRMVDATGRVVRQLLQNISLPAGEHQLHFEFDDAVPVGLYTIQCSTGQTMLNKLVVKQ